MNKRKKKQAGQGAPAGRKGSLPRRIGEALLVLSLLFLSWLPGAATAYGWLLHADHYGAPFTAFAFSILALYGLMTFAVLLYFIRLDLPSAILGTVSYVPALCILLKAVSIAEEAGWSGQTEASFGKTAASVWRNGMMWHIITLILLLVLALTRYFSGDSATARARKRAEKEPLAVSILAEPEETDKAP